MANRFNQYFCSFGNLTHENNPSTNYRFSNYLTIRVSASLSLVTPILSEIIDAIRSLNVNKAAGHDDILAFYLRIAAALISP